MNMNVPHDVFDIQVNCESPDEESVTYVWLWPYQSYIIKCRMWSLLSKVTTVMSQMANVPLYVKIETNVKTAKSNAFE